MNFHAFSGKRFGYTSKQETMFRFRGHLDLELNPDQDFFPLFKHWEIWHNQTYVNDRCAHV